MNTSTLATLNRTVEKLMTMLIEAQDRLRSCKAVGETWEIEEAQVEIASIERRLRLAERLQEEALR